MGVLTTSDAHELLKLLRLDRIEQLGREIGRFPILDTAVRALAGQLPAGSPERRRGLAATDLCARAVRALAPQAGAEDHLAYRAYLLLDAFYLKRWTRRQTLQRMGLGGGSFDRIRAQALPRFLDALVELSAQIAPLAGAPADAALAAPPIPSPKGFHVPPRLYRALWDKQVEQVDLVQHCFGDQGAVAVSISGLGGSGKTVLAREAAVRMGTDERCADVLWVSAQSGVPAIASGLSRPAGRLTSAYVLNQLARQVGLAPVNDAGPGAPWRALENLLRSRPYLIVIDGVDASEDEAGLVHQLLELTGPSSLLLTTRHPLLSEVAGIYPLHISTLSAESTVAYLRAESAYRGLSALSAAGDETLHQIYALTGGLFQALNLVMTWHQTWPLDRVLDGLQRATGRAENLYRHLFFRDWRALSDPAQAMLTRMGRMRPAASPALLGPSDRPGDDETAIAELVARGFVESHAALVASDQRYHLHSLVRQFVLSELPATWKDAHACLEPNSY